MASDVMASRVVSLPVIVVALTIQIIVPGVVNGQNTSQASSVVQHDDHGTQTSNIFEYVWFWPAVAVVGALVLCICMTGCCLRRRRLLRRRQQDDDMKMGRIGHYEEGPYRRPSDDRSDESSVLSLFDPMSEDERFNQIEPYQNPSLDAVELREALKCNIVKELAYEQVQTLERVDMSGPFRGEIRRGLLFPADREASSGQQVVIKSVSDALVPGTVSTKLESCDP